MASRDDFLQIKKGNIHISTHNYWGKNDDSAKIKLLNKYG